MAKVDYLLQGWMKQIVLTIVARLAHGFSPTANLAVQGITKPPNPESQNARKPPPTHGFLAKSNTCSRQITATDQSLPNSSRATRVASAVGCKGQAGISKIMAVSLPPARWALLVIPGALLRRQISMETVNQTCFGVMLQPAETRFGTWTV
jgi:hypothetical protein